jgi:hypothetical protein
MTDAGSESVRVRIGAIQRIPRLLTKQTPLSTNVGPFEALRLSFGGKPTEVPAYVSEMQRLIRDLFAEIRYGNSKDSRRELAALVDLLIEIGPEGWYLGKPTSKSIVRERGLDWVWKPPPPFAASANDTVTLFHNEPLDELNGSAQEFGGRTEIAESGLNSQFADG